MFFTSFIRSFSRGADKISELSISGFIASVVTIGYNILFFIIIRWELLACFLANIIGPLL